MSRDVDGVEGDEGRVDDTSLSESMIQASKSKANPNQSLRRAKAGDHKQKSVNGRKRVWKQAAIHGANNFEN